MVLGSLKRGKEPGMPLDVRGFSVASEKKQTGRERFTLSEEKFKLLLAGIRDEIAGPKVFNKNLAIFEGASQLKCLFPEQSAEITEVLDLENKLAEYQDSENFDLATRAQIKLLVGKGYQPFTFAPQELINRVNTLLESNNDLENAVYDLRELVHLKILFPSAIFDRKEEFLGLFKDCLDKYIRAEEWLSYVSLLAYLKILFPERKQEFIWNEYCDLCVALLAKIEEDIQLPTFSYFEVLNTFFYLAVIDANEVVVDEAGLHLINHPIQESLEAAAPAQPLAKEI